MRDSLASRQFCFRLPDVSDDLDLVDQGLVLIDVEDDCGALAMLRQDERTLGRADLVEETGCVRAKGRQRLNILARFQDRHIVTYSTG